MGLLVVGILPLVAEDAANATSTQRIVILGDSITAGYGLSPQEAYPALIQKKLAAEKRPFIVSNAGVSGDTTAGGLRRVIWAMGKGADILVIALGGNDGLRGVSPEETKKNLFGIVEKARKKNPQIEILIAGMQMPSNMGEDFTTRFKAVFSDVAKESKVHFIPYLLDEVGGVDKYNQPDRIHPTAEGQVKIADTVWKALQPLTES